MEHKLPITNDVLVAYLDGEVDGATLDYIEAHPDEFAAQLAELRSAENDLRSRMRGFRPISSIELGEYQLGYGSDAERARIASYLQQHPHAAKSLDILDEFLAELEPAPVTKPAANLLTQARIFVGKLLSDGTPQGAFAMGLRGEQEGVYEAGEYQVVVESDTDFDDPSKLALTGLLTGVDDAAGLTANLWLSAQARHVGSAEIDEFGNFGFGQLDAGQYELIISGDNADFEIHLQNVAVEN